MNLSKAFTRREKVLLLILAVLMVIASYYLAVYRPVTEALAEIRTQQTEVDAEIVALEAKVQSLAQMRSELEELLSDPMTVPIPAYNNLQSLMAFLNTTLSPTQNYTLTFEPPQLPTQEGDSIVRRALTLTFACPSYTDARTVINQLHNGPYRCQLQDIAIAPAAPPGRTSSKKRVLDIESYAVQLSVSLLYYEILTA